MHLKGVHCSWGGRDTDDSSHNDHLVRTAETGDVDAVVGLSYNHPKMGFGGMGRFYGGVVVTLVLNHKE